MTNLEYLKFYILDPVFQDNPFDVFRDQLSEVLHHNFVIGNNSFFEDRQNRIFNNQRILLVLFFSSLLLVLIKLLVVGEKIVELRLNNLLDKSNALFP